MNKHINRAMVIVGTLIIVLGLFLALGVQANASTNYNDPNYWEGQTTHESSCYKHEGNSSHGSITDNGYAVTLNTFNQSWPGDHWELLVVKGGSVDYGDGPGNKVFDHPTAGVEYFPPLNAAGNSPEVSHWIVCKGTTPPPTTTTTTVPPTTTTTSTTVPPTTTTVAPTTTTIVPTTTTTVPDTTTTTVPDTTTTTVPEVTTTTEPEATTTTTEATTTTLPASTTSVPTVSTLPLTGAGELAAWGIGAVILAALGAITLRLTPKRR